MTHTTLCGYELTDVRKTLREAIDRRDTRAAGRWTAELVATPGAIGSLWASFWLAWASGSGPAIPILLHQTWESMVSSAQNSGGDWKSFRNDPNVRATCYEMTLRLISQPRPPPVVWPSKEVSLFDISTLRDAWKLGTVPTAMDSPIVLRVWNREEDSLDLRYIAGQWVDSLTRGDIRIALSCVAWSLLPTTDVKCSERGPPECSPKHRTSPLWFWLDMGKSMLLGQSHPGWMTFHAATRDAFKLHYKRWTSTERMRVLLAWILQIRASCVLQSESLWVANAIPLHTEDIDRGYQEIAVEMSDPNAIVLATQGKHTDKDKEKGKGKLKQEEKNELQRRAEEKLRQSDAIIMKMMGM
jgi:hypothetical protein